MLWKLLLSCFVSASFIIAMCFAGNNWESERPADTGHNRAVLKLVYEISYNVSNETMPVTEPCGEYYAKTFLEQFITTERFLNLQCQGPVVRIYVIAKVRLLQGHKIGRSRGNRGRSSSAPGRRVKVNIQTFLNISGLNQHHINTCAATVRSKLRDVYSLRRQPVIGPPEEVQLTNIPASDSCPSAQMSPARFVFRSSLWVCDPGHVYDSGLMACITLTTTANTTELTKAVTSDPINVAAMSASSQSTVFSTSTAQRSEVTTSSYQSSVVASPTPYFGISVSSPVGVLRLVEGGDTRFVTLSVFVNSSHLCPGKDEKACAVYLWIKTTSAPNQPPLCRHSRAPIDQVVVGNWQTGRNSNHGCGMNVTNGISTELPLSAMLDAKYDGRERRDILFMMSFNGTENVVYTLPVEVENMDRKSTCQSINDPHITTFDGLEYNNYYEGEFVLYRHKKLPYAVHVIYQRCATAVLASCNCAVAILSGDDVFVIDRCRRRTTVFHRALGSKRDVSRMRVVLYKNGKLRPGTKIFQKADGKQYFIYLPHGAYVKVMVSGDLVNVWVVPSPKDFNQSTGLCGNNDANPNNDLRLRDGSVYTDAEAEEGKRGQPIGFILDWRIALFSEKSLFHGVAADSKLTDPPLYCRCGNRAAREHQCGYGMDVSTCDIYQGEDVTDIFVARSLPPVTKRQRRSIKDNLISLEDEPIDIDNKFKPKKDFKWDKSWNEVLAKNHCRYHIRDGYELGKLCSQIPGVNFPPEIQTCVEDIQITGNTSWVDSAREAMKQQCLEEIQKNASLPRDITDRIEQAMCVNDCSGHGQCHNGTCQCAVGYESADCSVASGQPPYVHELPKYGLCDTRYMNCRRVIVYGKDFVDSKTLKCHLQECEVADNKVRPMMTIATEKALFINFNAVECPVPADPAVHCYLVHVSNDGRHQSEPLLFIKFDSQCNTCSTNSTSCQKKRDSCIIDNACYKTGDVNVNDSCLVCKPRNNELQWTRLQDDDCRSSWWRDVPDWLVALVAAIAGSLIGLFFGILLYKCCCKSRPKTLSNGDARLRLPSSDSAGINSYFDDHMLHRSHVDVSPFSANPGTGGVVDGRGFHDVHFGRQQPSYEDTSFYNDGRGVENGVEPSAYF